MQIRRAKGLCFNCDERFHTGRRCKSKPFLLLLTANDTDHIDSPFEKFSLIPESQETQPDISNTAPDPPPPLENTTSDTNPDNFHLSLEAATSDPSPRTLRVLATINGHNVAVLVDSGSSHNIIQPRIASFLNLPTQSLPSFSVMVGNGEQLHCSGFCPNVSLLVDIHLF